MSQTVIDALKKLDPTNDNHWTADGFPRLDTVKMLAADATLTRESLIAVAPTFTRATVLAALPPVQGAPVNVVPKVAAAPPAPRAADSGAQKPTEQTEMDSATTDRETALEEVAAEISVQDERLVDLRAKVAEATLALKEASDIHDTLIEKQNALMPASSNADAIQMYLKRQRQILEDRGKRMAELKASGVSLPDILKSISRSPIDTARARKVGR